jgi:segregation and condensation protein B
MQGLSQKELIEERGRLELPGRPLLYGTTPHFLRTFELSALTELPPLPVQEENDMEETTLQEIIEDAELVTVTGREDTGEENEV